MLPSYRQPEKNRFLYMLEGWDKEWQSTNATHTISYNYLQPGEYTLRVKGAAAGLFLGPVGVPSIDCYPASVVQNMVEHQPRAYSPSVRFLRTVPLQVECPGACTKHKK